MIRPNPGDLVKVFSPVVWNKRLRGIDDKEYTAPFQVGMFIDDYWMDPDDEDRMGEFHAIVLVDGTKRHVRARNVEPL